VNFSLGVNQGFGEMGQKTRVWLGGFEDREFRTQEKTLG